MSSANYDHRYNHHLHHHSDSPRPSGPDLTNNWPQSLPHLDDFDDDNPILLPIDHLTRDIFSNTGELNWFDRQPSAAPSTPHHPQSFSRGGNESLDPEDHGWFALYPDDFDDQDLDPEYDDFGAEEYQPYMPRRQSRRSPGYVDLTREEATPPLSQERSAISRLSDFAELSETNMPSTTKRSRAAAASTSSSRTTPESSSGPSHKRPRLNSASMPQRRASRGDSSRSGFTTGTLNTNSHNTPDVSEIEHIDLADDKTSLAEALQKQRVEQVKAQAERPPADAPLRLSNITCVICMDSPKNITATACGHVFCHTCLMEALIAGENRAGYDGPKRSQCPVCRKTLNRTKASDVIPLLLKKGAATQPRRQRQT
ncbi:hypothetical protein IWX90DRAFT_435144 [Phyllosticta citrichinensis]|uniref:RING-type domain-containing protein n=1 Tax=Phyllosticta citrichinensis TaxID=1130410 RepID=A0ABR1XQ30_9PEZI